MMRVLKTMLQLDNCVKTNIRFYCKSIILNYWTRRSCCGCEKRSQFFQMCFVQIEFLRVFEHHISYSCMSN